MATRASSREGGGTWGILVLLMLAACTLKKVDSARSSAAAVEALEWYSRAVEASIEGNLASAVRSLETCLELDPLTVTPRLLLGRIHVAAGRPDVAAGVLEEVRRLTPDQKTGRLALAEAYRRSGRENVSVDVLLELHRLDPTEKTPVYLLHSLLLLGGREFEGLTLFRSLSLQQRPGWAFAREGFGDFLFRTGQLEEAECRYREALDLGGSETSLLRKLSLAQKRIAARRTAADGSAPPTTRPGLQLPAPPRSVPIAR